MAHAVKCRPKHLNISWQTVFVWVCVHCGAAVMMMLLRSYVVAKLSPEQNSSAERARQGERERARSLIETEVKMRNTQKLEHTFSPYSQFIFPQNELVIAHTFLLLNKYAAANIFQFSSSSIYIYAGNFVHGQGFLPKYGFSPLYGMFILGTYLYVSVFKYLKIWNVYQIFYCNSIDL